MSAGGGTAVKTHLMICTASRLDHLQHTSTARKGRLREGSIPGATKTSSMCAFKQQLVSLYGCLWS